MKNVTHPYTLLTLILVKVVHLSKLICTLSLENWRTLHLRFYAPHCVWLTT